MIGASCPYSTMKGPSVSSHTNLIHTLHLTSRPTPQGFLVGREDFGWTQLGRTGHFRGSCGALEVRSDFTLESPRNYLANKENKGWPTIPMNGHAWQSCDREKTSVASREPKLVSSTYRRSVKSAPSKAAVKMDGRFRTCKECYHPAFFNKR